LYRITTRPSFGVLTDVSQCSGETPLRLRTFFGVKCYRSPRCYAWGAREKGCTFPAAPFRAAAGSPKENEVQKKTVAPCLGGSAEKKGWHLRTCGCGYCSRLALPGQGFVCFCTILPQVGVTVLYDHGRQGSQSVQRRKRKKGGTLTVHLDRATFSSCTFARRYLSPRPLPSGGLLVGSLGKTGSLGKRVAPSPWQHLLPGTFSLAAPSPWHLLPSTFSQAATHSSPKQLPGREYSRGGAGLL
jgi:hypothetical protein